MYNNFIQKSDLTGLFDTRYLDDITENDDTIWQKIESSELERVASYTRNWYDMNHELRPINTWVDQVWPIGSRVNDSDVLYVAVQEVPLGTLITDTAYWKAEDDRNAVIVQLSCYLILYALSGRLGTKIQPQLAADRQQMAISELVRIQKGNVMLDLKTNDIPEDQDENEYEGQRITWGTRDIDKDYGY